MLVSTHAPARGATTKKEEINVKKIVSTHAPARGATMRYRTELIPFVFQPTHPHGVRRTKPWTKLDNISFNPRTRTGCDVLATFAESFRC